MQAGVGLLDTYMMPILHNHCLGCHHNFSLFYQLLDSNLFTHYIMCLHERSLQWKLWSLGLFSIILVSHLLFSIILVSNLLFCNLLLSDLYTKTQKYFTFCLSISISSHLCKLPWRDWQHLYRGGCKCLIVCAGIGDLRVVSNWIDTLVL